MVTPHAPADTDTDTGPDLVVAGAGGGLVAALRAAQHGLDVLVVEASAHFRRGNNTSMSTAMIPGAGTRFQRAAGIDDSPEKFVADMVAKTKGTVDAGLAEAMSAVSAELVEWMADELGVPIELVADFRYPGHSELRCHSIEGRHGSVLIDHLTKAVHAHPRIDLMSPTRLLDVTLDADRRVDGVVVELPGGQRERIDTRAVLLATNGFGARPDLVEQHIPEIARARYHGSEHSRGDAVRIGESLGARAEYLDAYQGHAALAAKSNTLVGWATVMHGGVMVNAQGLRFGDETTGYSEYAAALAAQPHARGWLVIDRAIHDKCLVFEDFRQTVDSGALVWADSPAELADAIGIPAEALGGQLDSVAAARRDHTADQFGRRDFGPGLSGPYAAIEVMPALFHTQGGLRVDERARVQHADGAAIQGLFASGGAAMGISGHGAAGYLAGNGLLPALGLSFLAADTVAFERTT